MKPPEKLIFKFGKRFEATAYGKLSVVLAFTLSLTVVAAWSALSAALLFHAIGCLIKFTPAPYLCVL
jgi:hypothetical protein